MKNYYKTNLVLTSALLLISLTFWGGIFALPILGLTQIIISILIFNKISMLTQKTKIIFLIYIILTITLATLFKALEVSGFKTIALLFIWMFVSAFLALFHLHITYRIKLQK